MTTTRRPDPPPAPGESAYRALLRLHPARFRRRYEQELVACFREAWWAEAAGRGPLAGVLFWARVVGGAMATSWKQRIDRSEANEMATNEEGTMGGTGSWIDDRGQDIRYALRVLRRGPGFAAAVLLTLGLSIGAATAVYTVVDGILLKPLPYPRADLLYNVGGSGDDGSYWLSAPNYRDMKESLGAFESMAAYTPDGANMVVEGQPARVSFVETDADFFSTVGVQPVLGRTYTEEERAAGAPVVVVSHALWQLRMGGSPDAIGSTLVLDGHAREVIGVLPAGAMIPAGTDIWAPLQLDTPEWRTRRGLTWIRAIGRLRPDADMTAVRAEAAALSSSLRGGFPDVNERFEVGLRSLEEATVGDVRKELAILLAAVGLVMLVAAINVGGLLLARATARQGEVAVRAALGGGRRRLAAQLVTESLVLAALGSVLGLAVGRVALAGLLAAAPPDTPRLAEISMGGAALRFALLAGLAAAVVFGVLPALAALRNASGALRASRGGGRAGHRLRGGLVVAQVALALALLFSAGLLGKSFWKLNQVDLGFRPEGVLVAGIPIGGSDFASAAERENYFAAILDRAKTLPGVREAAMTSTAPFEGFGAVFSYELPDRPAAPGANQLSRFRIVTPGLFATLGIPLLRGHAFGPDDLPGRGVPGAIVSEDLVRRHYPDADPLGRTLLTAGDTFTIIGVVPTIRDVTQKDDSPFPFVWVPVMPATRQSMTLVVKTDGDPAALAEPVRRAVQAIGPTQPVTPLRPMIDLVGDSAARPRFTLVLLLFFAAATLLLSGVGLYGLLAYTVGRRTREIGVRVALGAPAGRVRGLVMRQGIVLAAVGCGVGLVLAAWSARFLEGLLFQVDARDPTVLAGVALTLIAVAALAAWIPALRATRIAPSEALREE